MDKSYHFNFTAGQGWRSDFATKGNCGTLNCQQFPIVWLPEAKYGSKVEVEYIRSFLQIILGGGGVGPLPHGKYGREALLVPNSNMQKNFWYTPLPSLTPWLPDYKASMCEIDQQWEPNHACCGFWFQIASNKKSADVLYLHNGLYAIVSCD